MSLRVTGYQDGHRIVVDEGQARARVAGYGGSALGHTLTPMRPLGHLPRPDLTARNVAPRPHYERCGALVARLGLPCGRRVGHGDWHRSADGIAADVARRRAAR